MKSEGKIARRSAPKVKSGCLTWTRRIKCDETKPECVKCTSTGRTCDGYNFVNRFREFQPNRSSKESEQTSSSGQQKRPEITSAFIEDAAPAGSLNVIASVYPSIHSWSESVKEQRSWNYFLEKTAPALGGFFDVDFWCCLLPLVAAAEKSVRHALIAIGALHEEIVTSGSSLLHHRELPVKLYNKAIRSISQQISSEGVNHKVILLTCIIFTCLEFLRGMPELGLDHFQSGLKILIADRGRCKTNSKNPSDSSSKLAADEVDRGIVHAFSRLSIQASLIGRTPPQGFYQHVDIESTLPSRSDSFYCVREARDSLNTLLIQSLQPNEIQFLTETTLENAANQMMARYKLVASLHQWTTRLDLMVNRLGSVTGQDMDAIRLLRIQSIIAIIWNSTTLSGNESQFDSYTTLFESVISLASLILKDAESSTMTRSFDSLIAGSLPTESPPTFLFALEMGIIFPLYFTAIKCRCPSIRRRAVVLLSQVEPQRQGIWDARILGSISEYIIQFEEAAPLVAVSCDPITWPAEERRIHTAYNTANQDLEKGVQEVAFIWRPGGPKGEWITWSEEIFY